MERRRSTRLQAQPLPQGAVSHDPALAPAIAAGNQTAVRQTQVSNEQKVFAKPAQPTQGIEESNEPVNTFGTLLVIVYNTDLTTFAKPPFNQGRHEAAGEVKECYTRLINKLRSVGGLRVTARPGIMKGKEGKQVWIFLRAEDEKITQLVQREKYAPPFPLFTSYFNRLISLEIGTKTFSTPSPPRPSLRSRALQSTSHRATRFDWCISCW